MDDSVRQFPLLRFLLAYVGGLALADVGYPCRCSWVCVALLVAVLLVVAVLWRGAWGRVALTALFVVLGVGCYGWARSADEHVWEDGEELYEARVLAVPRSRQRSVGCELQVLAVHDSAIHDSAAWREVGHKVLAYMEPCPEAGRLLPGEIIAFKGRVRVPSDGGDSLAFDYARYMAMQGAAGVVYLPRGAWQRVGEARLTVAEHMLRLRQRLVERYMTTAFEDEVLGVLAALTLGDKRALSDEQREVYGRAGASHVLALSGMHVGVVYGMLALAMGLLLRRFALRWVREVLTVALLWLFALLVGMPASVVRAVMMCTLYVLARWLSDGTAAPLHVLSLTALVMLVARPLYLFDVGFQLSFMAMAAILWLVPRMEELVVTYRTHPVVAYVVAMVCMSVAAQLGTFPLVLHHFGTFPTYFLISNLLVVPCLSLVLMLSLAWWALLLTGLPGAQWLAMVLQHVVEWVNGALAHIGAWPGAVLSVDHYGVVAMLATYLFLLAAGRLIIYKRKRGAVLAMGALLAMGVSLLLGL